MKPNQPNHSRKAPSMTNGTLCGRNGCVPKPLRLPMISTITSAAIAALIWTTVPPAKSWAAAPIAWEIAPSPDSRPLFQTMCAIGA